MGHWLVDGARLGVSLSWVCQGDRRLLTKQGLAKRTLGHYHSGVFKNGGPQFVDTTSCDSSLSPSKAHAGAAPSTHRNIVFTVEGDEELGPWSPTVRPLHRRLVKAGTPTRKEPYLSQGALA